jgi:hypothetical protein
MERDQRVGGVDWQSRIVDSGAYWPWWARAKYKVFVSHASPDLWIAKQLVSHVRACGAETFLDDHKIAVGDDFEEIIISEAGDSAELLVLFTPVSRERKYVWLELGMFLGARKRIAAALHGVSMSEIAQDQLTPVMLKRIKSVDLNNVEEYFEGLKGRVETWGASHG